MATTSASEGVQGPPAPPAGVPGPARSQHAPSPQHTSRRPGLAAAHSSSKLHRPLPLAQPERPAAPGSPWAAGEKRPGGRGGSQPARPGTPLAPQRSRPRGQCPQSPRQPPKRAGARRPGPTYPELAQRGSRRAPGPEERDAAPARVPTSGPRSARRAGRSLQPPPPPPRLLLLRHLGRHLDSTPLPPPRPAAAAKAAPAPAPPPSGRSEDRLPPLAERRSYLDRASWVARRLCPHVSTRPGGGGPLHLKRAGQHRADPDQRAAVAHGLGRPPRAGRLPRTGGLPGAWERGARKAEPRAPRPLRGGAAGGGASSSRAAGGKPSPARWELERCAPTYPRYVPGLRPQVAPGLH